MYFKTSVTAGATIEVAKSYTRRIGSKARSRKKKPTPEEIAKVNQMNAERNLRIKINANFGIDDLFVTLTYAKMKDQHQPRQRNILKSFWIS